MLKIQKMPYVISASVYIDCAYICLYLALVPDIGKKRSLRLVYSVVGFNLIYAVAMFFYRPGTFRGGDILGNVSIVLAFSRLFLCLVAHQMVSMKYQDKDARGTK